MIRFLLFAGSLAAILFASTRKASAATVVTQPTFFTPFETYQWDDPAPVEFPNNPIPPDVDAGLQFHSAFVDTFNDWFYNQPLEVMEVPAMSSKNPEWLAIAELPANKQKTEWLRQAEDQHGIPRDILVRLAWQESRYNPAAYNAGSGASGIMQIVPRWHPGVDPWNVQEAIFYGGKYLSQLYRQFGTWTLALKAYNWGPGNVQEWLRGNRTEPLETRKYSAEILGGLSSIGKTYA